MLCGNWKKYIFFNWLEPNQKNLERLKWKDKKGDWEVLGGKICEGKWDGERV